MISNKSVTFPVCLNKSTFIKASFITKTAAPAISPIDAGLIPYITFCTVGLSFALSSIFATISITIMEGITRPTVAQIPPNTPPVVNPT